MNLHPIFQIDSDFNYILLRFTQYLLVPKVIKRVFFKAYLEFPF